jgi:hypothetical protein
LLRKLKRSEIELDPRRTVAIPKIDIRHKLVVSHVFELPLGQGSRFFAKAKGFTNALIGDWEVTVSATFVRALDLT